ncbi:fatty acid desaturase [Streptomyces sp. NPDC100445]|uniref:fatty acid desaturase n=1 Tax=Streptomyces sp. NPDC100445 TaxID=3366102 RepID=UPI0037FD6983
MSTEIFDAPATVTGRRSLPTGEQMLIGVFVAVPFLALLAAVPLAWRHGLSPTALALAFYLVSGLGITVGFHRHFTHGSFKASRPPRLLLALAGGLAGQGPLLTWVADHRKHHRYSDRDGDPHSPWRYGHSPRALAKGMLHAHVGRLFETEHASPRRYAPDLVRDRALMLVSRRFGLLVSPRSPCPPCWAPPRPGPGRARSPRSSGRDRSGSRWSTT